ncbi:glutathione peroxidase [Anaeromicropila herbilytica]|uniref:Glutathione peroxidase n=1 Tax=Anaeromicropila herbilytica TaxID=2785025 RepID=A0A7R7IDS1_9FIRM|nr:glutathione peroxidase [Anaeromicropila herbilytica]BCN31384.1 glutathione peroxidase [Anaeromicropila herbilytica]
MSIYKINVNNIMDEEISLSEYEGEVLLIVNTATRCGFTPQYDELQDLYEKYHSEGFVILDFPCNQFANQAPESNEEIASFCDAKFGITFPMHAKIEVKGDNAHPLYRHLTSEKGFQGFIEENETFIEALERIDPNYKENDDIKWNFTKFLVDRKGNVIERFEPTDPIYDIDRRIAELLRE